MPVLSRDTSPDIEDLRIQRLRQMPSWRKLELMVGMNRTVLTLAMVGLRQRHPLDSPDQRRRRLADMLLGSDLACKAYGPLIESD